MLRPARACGLCAAHIDMLPTFIDLCDLKTPEIAFDDDIREPIYGDGDTWKDRSL